MSTEILGPIVYGDTRLFRLSVTDDEGESVPFDPVNDVLEFTARETYTATEALFTKHTGDDGGITSFGDPSDGVFDVVVTGDDVAELRNDFHTLHWDARLHRGGGNDDLDTPLSGVLRIRPAIGDAVAGEESS